MANVATVDKTIARQVAASRDPTLLIFNIIHRRKHHSVVGSRLGATGQACGCQLGYRQDASLDRSRVVDTAVVARSHRFASLA
ncbi:MAG: hypothetical protein SPH89_03375 [Candidatus Limisoma sp.]|nr:hypothetical protein [Candidatus Limisoma sp.]